MHAQGLNANQTISSFLDEELGKESLAVFNGIRFYDLLKSNKEDFRYFESYKPFKATITYNGQSYPNIPARYDLINDHLVVYSEGKLSFFQTQIANSKVDAFLLDNLSFVRLDLSIKYAKEKNAFYELAYDGKNLDLFIAWSKAEKLKTNIQNPYYTFKLSQEYFFLLNEEYFQIKSKNDIIKLFPERKKEIREFYKAYKDIERKNHKQFMQKLAFYLDQNLKN
ncbi:MAG: hypothetical protein WA951_04760 [Leeuwenhoekiella sp.]